MKVQVPLSILGLINTLSITKSIEKALVKMKESYETDFLEQVKILYPIFRENDAKSDDWSDRMSLCIGTTEDEISEELKSDIVLRKNPTYRDLLCHTMVGCLVLQRKLTCSIGSDRGKTAEIFSIIKQIAGMIGLGVTFSKKEKVFRGDTYIERYATFFIKKS